MSPATPLRMDLERLIDAWRGPLIGLCASWGLSWHEAGEVAQDAFAEAYLGRERFRGSLDDDERVGAWLFGIARNLARARLRRTSRERERHASVDPDGLDDRGREATGGDPEGERAHRVRAAVEQLGDEQRQAIYVCYFEERPVRRAAALLGVSEKALEGRLYRARLALRRRLAELERADPRAHGGLGSGAEEARR